MISILDKNVFPPICGHLTPTLTPRDERSKCRSWEERIKALDPNRNCY
jgi:hypothetical protein